MTSNVFVRQTIFVSMLTLTACTAVGPDPADIPTPSVQAEFEEGEGAASGTETAFWSGYDDTTLNRLVQSGMGQSFDIMAANERIRAAAADMRAAGVLGSQVSGSSSAGRERSGGDGIVANTANTANLSASFVFDLFGGARRAREGATASYRSAEAEAQTTRLAWLAEVISAYADARFYQQALALTRDTIEAREATLEVTRNMESLGLATEYDTAQTEALLQTARADLPNYEAQFNAQVYRLSTLLNLQAQPLMQQMQRGSAQLRTPPGPGTGVPADLLRSRPDIRSAQSDYAAALAAVGVATADLLPSISLTGTVTDRGGDTTWGFGPGLSLPVFNQGALQAARSRKVSEARQAEIAWKSSVAAAVEDVQTAQSNLRRYRQRAGTLEQAANSYDRAYDLAYENFEAGALELVDLLEADRSRASARLAAASARNDAAKEWAALQIATGAGSSAAR
ncbi:efflux transporter outer membrane subunit [Paracoccus saliphilus]|uniref:Outer membrane protein, multidrug efflux system n=2 Tax=Paracoccus saliphilus TaxID=405559 RepID=A0AA45W668_9RHOB|nr:efflux transporter outer membrane subunit [Paracoccus saliphilus]SIS99236.1 outer membrane protein, multidrug efflux system [Paracoccus saliphilus]